MLTITERPATLGSSINTRVEKHGDNDVTALDIPLSGISLAAAELNALLLEPGAHDALFERNGSGFDPRIAALGTLRLKNKIEGANVSIHVGLGKDSLELVDCKLARVQLDPQPGGRTDLSVQVQCTPTIDKHVTKLLEHLGADVEVEIVVDGYGDQQALPLDKDEAA